MMAGLSRGVTLAFADVLSAAPAFQRASERPVILWGDGDYRAENAMSSAVRSLADSIVYQRSYVLGEPKDEHTRQKMRAALLGAGVTSAAKSAVALSDLVDAFLE